MPEINGISVPFIPLHGQNNDTPKIKEVGESFDSIFQQELEKIKFSSHALKRLEERQIQLSGDEMVKINSAVERAEQKGARDSLVMMDSTAFIVNIPNKTIVTALPVNESDENVFTNIDSVVFA
jgi:flagellar operon protein